MFALQANKIPLNRSLNNLVLVNIDQTPNEFNNPQSYLLPLPIPNGDNRKDPEKSYDNHTMTARLSMFTLYIQS